MNNNERRNQPTEGRTQSRSTKESEHNGNKRTEEVNAKTFEANDLFEQQFVWDNWEIIIGALLLWISEEIVNIGIRHRKLIRIVTKASALGGIVWLIRFMFRSSTTTETERLREGTYNKTNSVKA
ncbi:MAG: hypothetical protein ACTS41_01535 [Candidatus Hodgkinia cicadicola]